MPFSAEILIVINMEGAAGRRWYGHKETPGNEVGLLIYKVGGKVAAEVAARNPPTTPHGKPAAALKTKERP